jgi:hypothetical protein
MGVVLTSFQQEEQRNGGMTCDHADSPILKMAIWRGFYPQKQEAGLKPP